MDVVPRLHFELRASRQASSLVLVGCVATAALIAWLPLPLPVRSSAVIAIGSYGLWLLRWWAQRRQADSIVAVDLGLDHHIVLVLRDGRTIQGNVQADSYVGPLLTTIVLRADGSRRSRSLAITPDMLPREDLRKLRVMLRFRLSPRDAL